MEPNDVYGFSNDDITTTTDLDRVRKVLERSRVFREAAEGLRREGVTVTVTVNPELPNSGRAYGKLYEKERHFDINPSEIPDGAHVGDVYVHEFGHVWEDHGGPPADQFAGQVDRELGIREWPPSHTPLPVGRDPFAPPGTRDNKEKEYARLEDARRRGVHLAGNCWCGAREHIPLPCGWIVGEPTHPCPHCGQVHAGTAR